MPGAFGICLCKGLVISLFVTRGYTLSLITSHPGISLEYQSLFPWGEICRHLHPAAECNSPGLPCPPRVVSLARN